MLVDQPAPKPHMEDLKLFFYVLIMIFRNDTYVEKFQFRLLSCRKHMENDPTRHPTPTIHMENSTCFLQILFESFPKQPYIFWFPKFLELVLPLKTHLQRYETQRWA